MKCRGFQKRGQKKPSVVNKYPYRFTIARRASSEGFAYSNPYLRQAVIVVGPATSGEQYLNSIVHEIHHHSVAIADELGTDLKGEVPAYIAGDTAEVLVDIICMLGCGCRKNGEKVANQKK